MPAKSSNFLKLRDKKKKSNLHQIVEITNTFYPKINKSKTH